MSTLRYPSRIRTLRILRSILRHNIYLLHIPVLCLLRLYKRILSILIRHRYCKVQAIAFFNIQGIVISLLRVYLRTLSILICLRYRKVPDRALFDIPGSVMSPKVLPKDPRYPYSPEVPQGIRSRLVSYTRYTVMSAKTLPKDQ